MPFLELPNELLVHIGQCLQSPRDINSLTQTNHRLYSLLNSWLYQYDVLYCGSSAAWWAAEHGQERTLLKTLNAGADEFLFSFSETAAATTTTTTTTGSNTNYGRRVFRPLPGQSKYKEHPLYTAAKNGHVGIVKILLGRGKEGVDPDPDVGNDVGVTPLSVAVEMNHSEVVRVLLDKGADVDSVNAYGYTPLAYAIYGQQQKGLTDLLVGALEKLVSQNNRDDDDNNKKNNNNNKTSNRLRRLTAWPFLYACGIGHEAILTAFLQEHNGIPDADYNRYRLYPLKWAEMCGQDAVLRRVLQNSTNRYGNIIEGEALLEAAERGHSSTVKTLLDLDAHLAAVLEDNVMGYNTNTNTAGQRALIKAIQFGHEVTVKLILDKGVDPNFVDAWSETPLMWAAGHGHGGIVKLLLDKGADPDVRNPSNLTARDIAAARGHHTVAVLLRAWGFFSRLPPPPP